MKKIDAIISAIIATVLIVVFLGFYAIRLKSIPLWIILVGVLAMILFDIYESVIQSGDSTGS